MRAFLSLPSIVPLVGALTLALAGAGFALHPAFVALVVGASVLAAVYHAELLAHRVGEPFGTFLLAVAVTVIEVGLIVSIIQADPVGAETLARDTVMAAIMIILGGVTGACLLVGGIRHGEQRYWRRLLRCRSLRSSSPTM
jgi:Ca2+:H+ antiporter